ncbi:MAG TPA: GNAT family N-acetyltransferase [Chloroflexota bacterium]|nr:GNAT family N-acetyltransferase [Chloroflexota bacterium]
MHIRHIAGTDYQDIIRGLDDWWGGRHMTPGLPHLFFTHFQPTSFAVEEDGEVRAFLIGFISQTDPRQAYIHFVGVDPRYRGMGLGRQLYTRLFDTAGARGCSEVCCVTSPVNTGSIAFHRRMGFDPLLGDAEINGIPVHRDYDGPGEDRVVFRRPLTVDVLPDR